MANIFYSNLAFGKNFLIGTNLFTVTNLSINMNSLLKFLVLIAFSYLIGKFAKIYINKIAKKYQNVNKDTVYTLSRFIYYFIVFIGVIIVSSTLGIDFTAFAFIAGALSVGIGFGLQSLFNNFIAGIILLLEKNLRIGDVIQLESGEIGKVIAIKVRTTTIKTYDNLEILIPNSEIVLKKFINYTLSEVIRRIHIPFSISYDSDKNFVKEIIIKTAKTIDVTVLEKEPDVWIVNLGPSGLECELVVWVNDLNSKSTTSTQAKYLWAIHTVLEKNNVQIPYPTRDVRLIQK